MGTEDVVPADHGIGFSHKRGHLPFAVTWRGLGGITPSEISQTENNKYCRVPPICRIKKAKVTETESSVVVTRGWQVGAFLYSTVMFPEFAIVFIKGSRHETFSASLEERVKEKDANLRQLLRAKE